MSYELAFAPDAYSQWRELEGELQERVLDELDLLAANPPAGPPEHELIRDFVRRGAMTDDLVFLRLILDRPHQKVILTGVAVVTRPHA